MPERTTVMVTHNVGTQITSWGVFENTKMVFVNHERMDVLSPQERWEAYLFLERAIQDAWECLREDDKIECWPTGLGFAMTWRH